jgi:CheY-like chemotaxis protein
MGVLAACDGAASPRADTVLVVEDEVLVRFALAELLRNEGYAVIEAANADEALEVLATPEPIDLVLTDVNMPGSLDGVALGRHVRATRPALKVIVVSGLTTPDHAKGVADAFLVKPYTPRDITMTVATLLANRPA